MDRFARAAALAALCFTLLFTGVAEAEIWSVSPCVADHTGLFLRLAVGVSGVRLKSDDVVETRSGGAGALWDFALGWSVAPRVGVHLGYYGARPFVPRLSLAGAGAETHDEAEAFLSAIALGTTLHLPSNLYLSPNLGVALLAGTHASASGPKRARFDPGVAAGFDVGWEFWVSPQWALGVALKASYYYVRDDDSGRERTWHGVAAGPLFTATFN